jgi:phenylacetate-CoA ligase
MTPATESATAPFEAANGSWRHDLPVDAPAIAAWQLGRAWEVVERVAQANPFYRQRLSLPSGRDAAAFRCLPVTRKDEVVADCGEHPPYGSRSTGPEDAIAHIVETSGTSGQGKEIYTLDADDQHGIFEAEATGFWWAGVRPGSRVLLCLPVTMQAAGKWYYGGLGLLRANVLPVGSYGTERKISILRYYGCNVVVTTPSYLARLTDAVRQQGVDPATLPVESIVVAGEPYGVEWARRMEQAWQAALFEQYGCTERAMAWACPPGVVGGGAATSLRTLHFPAEIAYCEVVDRDSGEQVADGEWGELVVTPLIAESSPLVRFATGDRVRYRAPGACDCSRPLPGITAGSVYRFDDMMKVKGTNLWPGALDTAILAIDGVLDYRGVVRHDEHHAEVIEVRAEVDGAGTGQDVRIARALRERFNLSVLVTVCPPGSLSGEESDRQFVKVRRWRDDRRLEL